MVPTIEPCLQCRCISRTLICALRMCPEQPIPPPRGCILVHKNKSCCPHLSCKRFNVISHDQHSNRVPSYEYNYHNFQYDVNEHSRIREGSNYLRRSDDEEFIDESGVCIHNGTVYRPGSAMTSSTLCSYCYCIGGRQKCVKPKCVLAPNGCRAIFVKSMCCPIRYDCSKNDTSKSTTLQLKKEDISKVKNRFNKYPTRSPRGRGIFTFISLIYKL